MKKIQKYQKAGKFNQYYNEGVDRLKSFFGELKQGLGSIGKQIYETVSEKEPESETFSELYPYYDFIVEMGGNEKYKALNRDRSQTIPVSNDHPYYTLRTKGVTNLADVPKNMLDSIAVNSGRSGTNFWTNMGLVAKESMFGGHSHYLGYPLPEYADIDPSELVSNWNYLVDNPYNDYYEALVQKYGPIEGHAYEESDFKDAEENAKYAVEHGLIRQNTPHYSTYVLADAFKRFQHNPKRYNLGQSSHVPMVYKLSDELQGEKQLQKYWNTRGKQEYQRGQKEGISPIKFRLTPKELMEDFNIYHNQ